MAMDPIRRELIRNALVGGADLPDGTVKFTEWNDDDDGVEPGPIKLHVKLTVNRDEMTADSSGTGPDREGEEEMPSKSVQTFARGNVLRAEMAGSGGDGNSPERDPAAVGEDGVRQEKVSIEHALAEYGVVVDARTLAIDGPATEPERERRATATSHSGG